MRITRKDISEVEAQLSNKNGYRKYRAEGRYGYIGIDEYSSDNRCLRTYRTGLTKKEAYYCLLDLLNG